jgi:hypothetical protein
MYNIRIIMNKDNQCKNILKIMQERQSLLNMPGMFITRGQEISYELRVSNYMKAIEMWTKLYCSTTTLEDALSSQSQERYRENI